MNAPNSQPAPRITRLSPDDALALDALLDQRRLHAGDLRLTPGTPGIPGTPASLAASATSDGPAAGEASDPRRMQRVASLLSLLEQCPAEEPSPSLAERTLAAVHNQRQRERFVQQVSALTAPTVAFRWNELIAVAAVLMIGVSLAWPLLSESRSEARRIACQSNLQAAGVALANYAGDHQGLMPRARQGPNTLWWDIGQDPAAEIPLRSNAANMYVLAREGYLAPQTLNCPENPQAPRHMSLPMLDWPSPTQVSYSYQSQDTPRAIRLVTGGNVPVIADRNPLLTVNLNHPARLQFRQDLPLDTASSLHQYRGQNVLMTNGSVIWSPSPVLGQDNIWINGDHHEGVEDEPGDANLTH